MRLHDILAYLPFARDRASPVSESTHQHAVVVEAIALRDGPAARRAMERHIAATNEIILGVIHQRSPARAAT
jgi:DNA-binding GntR family transcriptional regulator